MSAEATDRLLARVMDAIDSGVYVIYCDHGMRYKCQDNADIEEMSAERPGAHRVELKIWQGGKDGTVMFYGTCFCSLETTLTFQISDYSPSSNLPSLNIPDDEGLVEMLDWLNIDEIMRKDHGK